ncbi:LamG domain-containing protein, partial [Patescibacteria group bacterium]|nr:LamG domain-containing protein [Patescibacteria group bacterium]
TVEAWIKRGLIGDGLTGEQTIIGKWDETTGNIKKSYRLWFDINNRLNFAVFFDEINTATITQKDGICLGENTETTQCLTDANCATGEICKNAPIIDTKKWHHVSGKYIAQTSDNNPSLQIFIDGSKVPTSAVVGTTPNVLIDQTEKLYIGATPGKTTYFNGKIDNVSIWSCINAGKLRGRQPVDIWDDAKIEIDGWARVINLGEKGWLKLKGFTKDGRVWGSFLDNYTTFYTFNGYMANRWVDESMDSNGLVAHWKMNEPNWDSDIPVNDFSVNANHGTANGVNVTKKGIFNSAGDFDGVDDYVSVADSNTLDVSQITLIGWIKPDISNVAGAVIEKVSTYGIRLSSGKMNFVATTQNNAWSFAATNSATTMSSGIWYHVAITYDGTTARYYLNGSADGTDTSRTGDLVASTQPVKIGLDTNSIYFNGFIDNLAIYNRVLSPTEILTAYNKSTPACVGWDDYEHEYGDPPAPLPFNSLSVANGDVCTQLLVYWTPSTWAESYTYWRCNSISESGCTSCSYTETNVLDESCTPSDCYLSDIGLDFNTGYCYKIQAHNETGSTWATNTPPTYPAPYWKSTTLCAPAVLPADTNTCGQVILNWTKGENTDGYNIYRSLAETGSTSCDSLTNNGCELTGHLAEALDYNADNGTTNDLIAQWKMNEANWIGTAGEVADSSAQTPLNNGTAVDADALNGDGNTPPTTTAGIFDNAGSFDGVDDYVTVGNMESHNNTAYTIEFWVNGAAQEDKRFYSESNTALAGPFFGIGSGTGIGDTGKARVFIRNDNETTALDIESTSNVLDSAWHHIAWVDNNGSYVLYIDGTQNLSGSYTKNSKTLDDANIGRHNINSVPGSYFTGLIDNFSIYNVAKTAEQIRIDYESGNCGETGCGLAYVCDDGTAPHDKCGTANTCCYTDSRIIPYINYYYQITATGETGETPPSAQIGPEQTICFPAPSEQEE